MPSTRGSACHPRSEASRKRSSKHATRLVDDSGDQRTISDLFSTSKQGLKQPADDLPLSSPSKRLKQDHNSFVAIDPQQVKTHSQDAMYSFPSSKPRPALGIVDLTSSPHGNPMKKRTNGLNRPSNLAAHPGPKKLVVKNLRTVAKPNPDEYFQKAWEQLSAALTAIFTGAKLPYSMEELYKGVEFSCRQDRALNVFQNLRQRCSDTVKDRAKECEKLAAGSKSKIQVLRTVIDSWLRWQSQFDTIRSIFFYLDRSFLIHSMALPMLKVMGTDLFRDHVFLESSVQNSIIQGACDLVSMERKRMMTEQDGVLLQRTINMFHSLAVYGKHFEPQLLAESEQYYLSWVEQTIASNDLMGYVEMCDQLISQEKQISSKLGLEQTTNASLQEYMEEILIDQRQDRLVAQTDLADLLARNNVDILQRLYALLQRCQLGDKLRPAFEAYIVRQGSEIVFDEKREQEMVVRLLDLKQKLDTVLEKAFEKNSTLGHSLREAFEEFMNKTKRTSMTWGTDNPKPGEMIAKHVDAILKGGAKAVRSSSGGATALAKAADEEQGESSGDEDEEISKSLDQVLDLFRFVHGKAVFEAFYKRDLARRLLLGRSASADAEKSMLTRLKTGELQWWYHCILSNYLQNAVQVSRTISSRCSRI